MFMPTLETGALQLANRLAVELDGKVINVTLREPISAAEIYYHFLNCGEHPIVDLSGDGVARVSFAA